MYINNTALPRTDDDDNGKCDPHHAPCSPSIGPGPAMNSAEMHPSAASAQSETPTLFSSNITHIGTRNFIGIIVLGVLCVLGTAIWLSFAKWPRGKMRAWRQRRQAHRALARQTGSGARERSGQWMERDDDASSAGGVSPAMSEAPKEGKILEGPSEKHGGTDDLTHQITQLRVEQPRGL